jgi:hypothetical protein
MARGSGIGGLASLSQRRHRPPARYSREDRELASKVDRDIEAKLTELLNRVIDWLKFAEAKNTGAVGLSSTALGVIVTFLVAGPPVPDIAGAGLGIGAVVLMVSLLLAVGSFLPSTNLEKHLLGKRVHPSASDNLMYYGHLARYEPRALAQAIAEHYFDEPGQTFSPSNLAVDLAEQIVANARITVRKLESFKISLLLFSTGVLIAAISMAFAAFVL